jgi:hypothetical protein
MDKGQRSSYLSSNVKKLIRFQPDCFPHKGCYGYPFFKDGLLNWNAVEEICNLDQCMHCIRILYIDKFSDFALRGC